MNADELVQLYLKKEEVTKRLIEKRYPSLFSDIMEHLKEKEKKLDQFFIDLNQIFQTDPVLERFRKEKNGLMKLGDEMLSDLIHKEQELQKKYE